MNEQTFAEQITVVQARHHEREKELLKLLRRWNRGRYQSGTACWFCGQIPEKIQGSEEWLWNYKDCHLDHCELAEELADD